jgi:flavonol synthase
MVSKICQLHIHLAIGMQILSNGKYKAVLHRTTVAKDRARMSWPVFLEPPGELVVGPLPQFINKDNPPKFKTKKFKDYTYCKLNKLPQ